MSDCNDLNRVWCGDKDYVPLRSVKVPMDEVATWTSLEKEIRAVLPEQWSDNYEVLCAIHIALRRMRKCIDARQITTEVSQKSDNKSLVDFAFESIAAKSRPPKSMFTISGSKSQRNLSLEAARSLRQALDDGCRVLESLMVESQYRQYRLACWQDGLELLAQGQISEAEALVRTISALQFSDGSRLDFGALCQMKRGLVRYQATCEQRSKLQTAKRTQSYLILEQNLECYSKAQQTLGTLKVDSETFIPVYVEWKLFKEESWLATKLFHQVQDLSAVLGSESAYILKLLSCRGVVHGGYEQGTLRCGLVYNLPLNIRVERHHSLQTLHALLYSSFHPSLSSRFKLARDIATGLFYLHTVGWIHKEIRSSNVLLFPPSLSQRSLSNPKLMGLTYARSDDDELDHISNKPVSDKLKENFDLWRHPEYQNKKKETRYRQAYDIYSLGLVLFEIGRWKALDQMFATLQKEGEFEVDTTNFGARLLRRECQKDLWSELEYHTGDVYARVVSSCIDRKVDEYEDEELVPFMLNNVVLVLDSLVQYTSLDG